MKIGVVGGGITGAVAASRLSKHFSVVLWDQGRRGPGGRASHRSVDAETHQVQMEVSDSALRFDHGCQFFRADTTEMQQIAREWCKNKWAAPWKPRIRGQGNFFGLPSDDANVYAGVGGMHTIPQQILNDSSITVHKGTRVSSIERAEKKWQVWGISGEAAYHDTDKKDTPTLLDTVDALLFTDASSSFSAWHKASAGIPSELLDKFPKRPRIPLFSCMVALETSIRSKYDAVVLDNSDVWFAACSQSKPGFSQGGPECWTLVSTPAFALQQIRETTMQDPETGAFRPQRNDYLNTVPGPLLWKAFAKEMGVKQEPIYLQAQRWGSGLPCPMGMPATETILGVEYTDCHDLVFSRPETDAMDFVEHETLFYAGDFCSHRCPGFEASTLSAIDVADRMVKALGTSVERC